MGCDICAFSWDFVCFGGVRGFFGGFQVVFGSFQGPRRILVLGKLVFHRPFMLVICVSYLLVSCVWVTSDSVYCGGLI